MKQTTVIIFFIIFLISNIFFAQDRISKSKATIGNTIINEICKAKGWMLNPDEEWQSMENTIPIHLSSEFESILNFEKKGLGTDNFEYYQLRNLSFENVDYYILIKKYRNGYYTNSNIEDDWNDLICFNAYIFKKPEWDKIKSIEDGKINLIEIELVDNLRIQWRSENEAYSLIPTLLDWNKPPDKKPTLILHIAPYKEKNIVQFQIYTTYGKKKIIGGIIQEYKVKDKKKSNRKSSIYLTNELFDNCYYEIDHETFNRFIKLN